MLFDYAAGDTMMRDIAITVLRGLGFTGRRVAAVLGLTESYVATRHNLAVRGGTAALAGAGAGRPRKLPDGGTGRTRPPGAARGSRTRRSGGASAWRIPRSAGASARGGSLTAGGPAAGPVPDEPARSRS